LIDVDQKILATCSKVPKYYTEVAKAVFLTKLIQQPVLELRKIPQIKKTQSPKFQKVKNERKLPD